MHYSVIYTAILCVILTYCLGDPPLEFNVTPLTTLKHLYTWNGPTAKTHTRDVLPTCQDKLGHGLESYVIHGICVL